jgi:tricorn protease
MMGEPATPRKSLSGGKQALGVRGMMARMTKLTNPCARPLPAYLRQPTIQGDTVVFVADDDLWRVSAEGGIAWRLTAGLGEPATPSLSPDGRWLAYIGRDEMHGEVFVMPAAGGPARRLTWLGADSAVRGWTADGRVLFCSNHGQPFFRNWHAFTVAPEGGAIEALPLGQVNHLAWHANGARAIGRNTADPARWKRYRGGTAGHLWVDADGSGEFRRLKALKGNLTSPMWLGDRLYFLGDGEGVGNLHSCRADGSDVRRHTDHETHYARHAQSDGRRIVYQCGAELWLYDPATDGARALEIDVPSARTQAARRFVPAPEHLHGALLHPAGHSVAVEARGQLFSFPLWEGAVRRHAAAEGARHRFGQWLGDGKRLVGVADAAGEEQVFVFDADGTARALAWDIGRAIEMKAAPTGTKVALANHRHELIVGDVDGGAATRIERSDCGRIRDLAWSPCGGWLAYAFDTTLRHTAIKLLEVASGRTTMVTEPEFRDWSPSFDPAGKYLYFLSLRTYDPVYDSVQFELSFPRAARPYLVALQAGGTPPFDPPPKGPGADDNGAKPKPAAAAPEPLVVHLDGIVRRVAAFPVHEGRYGQIAGLADGKVAWTLLPIAGAHGRGGHKEGPGTLELFDFATAQAKKLLDKAEGFGATPDGRTLLVREGQRLRSIAAKPRDEKEEHDDKPSRQSGWLDLGRIRLAVEPALEWRQMLREVWRLQRDHFWTEDMSGVDWAALWQRYEPLLARVATRSDVSDLIWELQGELGTSHAYEMGGDHRKPPPVALGFLAAELRPGEGGNEIRSIVQGDAWDASADSPLNAVGVEARVGERIVAVGGQKLAAGQPAESLLVHQAGSKVALTIADSAGRVRDVTVTLLADEVPARYRAWVEANRAWVHERSGGRVGYFHLPDMMSAGFAEFHRYFAGESDRDALIVDVRYNRGGHVSQLLLEKVARRRIAWNVSRWGRPECYPDAAPAGPVVALTNEHAGSDGDIFSHGFKLMGIGELVGMRTWGGVIGIWPRHVLADGSQTTQPEYSFWFKDAGWGVENYGTDPTIEVDNTPQDAAAGRDRQLETALQTALTALERGTPALPDFGPRPNLKPPALAPRAAR